MAITHEQARALIQLRFDRILQPFEQESLNVHLFGCGDCRAYGNEIEELERLLAAVRKRRWNGQPIPLTAAALLGNSKKKQPHPLLTMRMAALGLVFSALIFSAWQFITSGSSGTGDLPLMIPPAPTPSIETAQFTSTTVSCERVFYTVQEGDTVVRLAARFMVSEEELRAANSLQTGEPGAFTRLVIPVCNSTPTGTLHPATFTSTNTPTTRTTTSTPGG